jgi:hypothetical protein
MTATVRRSAPIQRRASSPSRLACNSQWDEFGSSSRAHPGAYPAPSGAVDDAQKKWGPALLPAPTAPSEGSAGVRNLVCFCPKAWLTRSRSWLTSSGVAFHPTAPSEEEP